MLVCHNYEVLNNYDVSMNTWKRKEAYMNVYWKRKINAGLALVLVFTMFLSIFIIMPAPVNAAVRMQWYNNEQETSVSVEAGSRFYFGDFVSIIGDNISTTASLVKASYSVQDQRVATINKKGYLKARKVGITDVTVSYQGQSLTCHLTVVAKNSFEKSEAVMELRAAAKKIVKGMPKKLNAAKAYTLRAKRDAYINTYETYSVTRLAYDGFLYEKERPPIFTLVEDDYRRCEKLAVPEAGRYLTMSALLRQFYLDNNPMSITSKKTMRIASAAASSKKGVFNIKLTKKLSTEQILVAQMAYPYLNSSDNGRTKANIRMSIYDETDKIYYTGEVLLKKGSKQLTVKPMLYVGGKYETVEIEAGHVYMLESAMTWANGTRVTAK